MRNRITHAVVFLLFFLSGACGLIYQVVWSRMLTHIFGSTTLAVSTVLAAFMAGLAVGSYFLGRRGDRISNPLRGFAFCEIGIGLAALLLLLLLNQLTPLYIWITRSLGDSTTLLGIARFVLALFLLLLPTTLMGATLPFLSRFSIRSLDKAGHTLAALYGTNALGAIFGCLAAGFLLIGSLGTHRTVVLAVLLNIGIGAVAWLLSRIASPAEDDVPDSRDESLDEEIVPSSYQRRLRHLLLWCFGLSGVTSLAYEVFWTRALIFFVGNSTYAFSTMLSAFLVGIAGGSYLVFFFIDRLKNPIRAFAWIQIGIAVSAAAAMPLLIWLMQRHAVQGMLFDPERDLRMVQFARFGLSFAVMLLPTLLIGMTFPLVGRIILRSLNHTSADIGRVYAVNTLGNIAGALLPVFLIIPLLGIQKGIWLMALVNFGVGALFLAHGKTRLHPWRLAVSMALMALLCLIPTKLGEFRFPSQGQSANDAVLFYREGSAATTMVYEDRDFGPKHMAVDGIKIGGTEPSVDYKQQWLAHLPKLLMPEYRTELSIGLGSGILAGESVRHRELEKITCVEIAPSVVEGAKFFSTENHGILDSPRAEIIVADGVNFLMATPEKFDIISTDGKTQPEYSVNGTFFSKDYYTLMRGRLAPGGIAIQWIALDYPPRIFRIVLKTFGEVFPHVMMWQANGNCFLVGSNHEVTPDMALISKRLGDGGEPFGSMKKLGINSPETLVSHFVTREDMLLKQLAGTEVNTLEKPVIEFYDFDDFAESSEQRELENLGLILSMRGKGAVDGWLKQLSSKTAASYEAGGEYLLGQRDILQRKGREAFGPHFDRALLLAPENESVSYQIFGHYFETAKYHAERREARSAEAFVLQALEAWPDDAGARLMYGQILLLTGRELDAMDQFEISAELDPERVSTHHLLVQLHFKHGNIWSATKHLRAIIEIKPDDIDALYRLGFLLGEQGDFIEALELLGKAYRIDKKNPRVIHCYAWTAFRSGDKVRAREIVLTGGEYYKAANEMSHFRDIILR